MRPRLFAACLALTLLCGCSGEPGGQDEPSGPVTLRVLTDSVGDSYSGHVDDGGRDMDTVTKSLARKFESEHEDVTVELEFLPSADDAEARSVRLEQLRTEIMAGGGPDVYLLPGSSNDNALFKNVGQSMRAGLFLDISHYYDDDGGLDKSSLLTAVMDGGVVDGARYVLPLRYEFPVFYVSRRAMEQLGITDEDLSTAERLYSAVVRTGDPKWAMYAWTVSATRSVLSAFPPAVDEATGDVTLTEDELAGYLELLSQVVRLGGGIRIASSWWWHYAAEGWFPLTDGNIEYDADAGSDAFLEAGFVKPPAECGYIMLGNLDEALDTAAVSKAVGLDLAMFPFRAADGSLTATVTWWGAVGAGTENASLAYEFLRMSLLEDAQWECDRPIPASGRYTNRYTQGLVARGWPVMVRGSVTALWQLYSQRIAAGMNSASAADNRRARSVRVDGALEDGDIPILELTPDHVRFEYPGEAGFRSDMVDVFSGTADPDSAAREFLDDLRWSAAEG